MKQIIIFCEGVADQVFLADCLKLLYGIEVNRVSKEMTTEDKNTGKKIKVSGIDGGFENSEIKGKIQPTGGCKNLRFFIRDMKNNIEESGKNIVIFDADDETRSNGNKGINNARKSLDSLKKEGNFDYYLWPDNKTDGDIEILLRELIPESKKVIMDCIERHQECLKNTKIQGVRFEGDDRKRMLEFYLYANSIQSKEQDRNYKDTDYWELDWEKNIKLKALKDFLGNYFVQNF